MPPVSFFTYIPALCTPRAMAAHPSPQPAGCCCRTPPPLCLLCHARPCCARCQVMFAHLALGVEPWFEPRGFWRAFKDYDGQPVNIRWALQPRRALTLFLTACITRPAGQHQVGAARAAL